MKRALFSLLVLLLAASVQAQQEQSRDVPEIPFESVPNFLKYSPDMNLGEVLYVADMNSWRVQKLILNPK